MNYVRFGNTGLQVSRLCLGCMTYGDPGWREWVLDEAAATPFIRLNSCSWSCSVTSASRTFASWTGRSSFRGCWFSLASELSALARSAFRTRNSAC